MENQDKHIACVVGTRPEVIKMAPIIFALRDQPNLHVTLICTAQHRHLMDDMLAIFNLKSDVDLNIMKENQTLSSLTADLFAQLEPIIKDSQFDFVLAQGDTTTTWVTAQLCFYHKIPFGHVEAGLRSYDFYQPFPEEMNRVFVSKLATWHFAPTQIEQDILLKEGISAEKVQVTGNTVIDALYMLKEKNTPLSFALPENKKMVLITLHRRENFGQPIRDILSAILALSESFPDVLFVYPVHPNPNVNALAYEYLSSKDNIKLIPPVAYDEFVTLMKSAYLILSDSGGIQEEAPALGKPVLVLRNKTERPLVIEWGLGQLVGMDKQVIIKTVTELLTDQTVYQRMAKGLSPYGDGNAAKRIVDVILTHYNQLEMQSTAQA